MPLGQPMAQFWSQGGAGPPIFIDFETAGNAQKIHVIFVSLHEPPIRKNWNPKSAPGEFWDQFSRILDVILASFSDFLEILRKCQISEEYNAKRRFEASKTYHFGIVFSLFSHFFPTTLPEATFGGSKCPSILKSLVWDGFPLICVSTNRPMGGTNCINGDRYWRQNRKKCCLAL